MIRQVVKHKAKVSKTNIKKIQILFYDIETSPMLAYIWSLGEQHVNHGQLKKGSTMYGIICISYAWGKTGKVHTIDWGYKEQNTKKVIEEFDKLVKKADIIIGKNNTRFDDKHLNTHRMFNDLEPMPEWLYKSEDVEKQLRRFFYLPSYSLDYFSKEIGLGGKIKMDMNDWIHIVERTPKLGLKALNKMKFYNRKDVRDTRTIWYKIEAHCKPKHNIAAIVDTKGCVKCGSMNFQKRGFVVTGNTKYQLFRCSDCDAYAGRRPINSINGRLTAI